VEMRSIIESSSPLPYMRILNKRHVQDICGCLLKKLIVFLLTLRLVLYYDAKSHRQVQFDFVGTLNQFEEVWKKRIDQLKVLMMES
jgi:hypothetical protein